jgi:hypothetical protein
MAAPFLTSPSVRTLTIKGWMFDVNSLSEARAVLRYRTKQSLGRHPSLYFPVFRRRNGYRGLLVTEDTDLCIDGFPRSANSFAVGAFEHAHESGLSIAHHTHVPAQLLRATDLGIPTVALIRDPVDAVVSGRGLELQIAAVNDRPEPPMHVSFGQRLQAWIDFYRCVEPYTDYLVIAPFEVVIRDMNLVVDAVNRKFGTSFARFDHSESTLSAIRSGRGYHALPSQKRDDLKQQAHRRFQRELSPNHPHVQEARCLFGQLTTLPLYV